jgi:hypothetical protein
VIAMKALYEDVTTSVKSTQGESKEFGVKVGVIVVKYVFYPDNKIRVFLRILLLLYLITYFYVFHFFIKYAYFYVFYSQ